jgi:tetratricopeptide (TPR) repeat protein
MLQPEKTSVACLFCGEPATSMYTIASQSVPVCGTCNDQQAARNAYEYQAMHVDRLARAGKCDDALAFLDGIWEANRHLDHDHWLARQIAGHRAFVLWWDAKRYVEAEQVQRDRAQLGFEHVADRWEHGEMLGRILEDQGRTEEALAVLEEALSHQDPLYASSLYRPLGALARLSRKLGRPLAPKWLSLARDLADAYGVELPQGESVAEILLTLKDTVAGMLPKHAWEAGEDSEPDPDEDSPPDTAAT